MSELIVINNFVEIPKEEDVNKHDNDFTVLFLGKMDYEPNITAVKYFVTEIFPSLKRKFPSLIFQIVGANPTKDILGLSSIPGIVVTGFVKSTMPYFKKATIVVAPMLTGAGVQNKIIQAMSYCCCVVTTDIGAEGLNLKGDELAIFNDTNSWINGIIKLLNDRTKRRELGNKARLTIENTLSKEIVYKQFCKLLNLISN